MEEQFNLADTVSGLDKAKADRDFYLSMVYNRSAASPIAAYLAGVAGAKASTYQGKIQEQEAAVEAANAFTKRRDTMINNLSGLLKDIDSGNVNPSAAAPVLAPLMKEAGIGTLQQYDADNKTLVYQTPEGQLKQINFSNINKADLQREKQETDISLKRAKEKDLQERGQERAGLNKANIEYKQALTEAAKQRAKGGSGSSVKNFTSFKAANKAIFDTLSDTTGVAGLMDLSDAQIEGYLKSEPSLTAGERGSIRGTTDQVRAEAISRGLIPDPENDNVSYTSAERYLAELDF